MFLAYLNKENILFLTYEMANYAVRISLLDDYVNEGL